jgi:hypothetical protein
MITLLQLKVQIIKNILKKCRVKNYLLVFNIE